MIRYLLAPVVEPRIVVWTQNAALVLCLIAIVVHWVAHWNVGG